MAENNKTQSPKDVKEELSSSEAFINKYLKPILTVLTIIVLVIVAIICYKKYIAQPRETKASVALFKGEQYFTEDAFEKALNGDSLGYEGFAAVAKKYSGTAAANLANAYAGISYAQLGQYEEAIKYLDKFTGKDQLVGPAIMAAMGNCYAQMDQFDKAAALLIKAAKKADSRALSPIYLLQAGQLYEKMGKGSEALSAYKDIKDKYFGSYIAVDIDKYIERVSK